MISTNSHSSFTVGQIVNMVPLLQLFLLLPLIHPFISHVHGNFLSPMTTHSNHSLFSYCSKKQTYVLVKKTDQKLSANAALVVRPFLHGFYGKSLIKSIGDSNEWTESRNTEDIFLAKTSHTETGSRGTFLVSHKDRVKRGSTQNVMLPQDASGKEKETVNETNTMRDDPVAEFKEKDLSSVGSGDEENGFVRSSTEAIASLGEEHAQNRPQVQTAHSVLASLATVHTNPTINPSQQTSPSATAPPNEKLLSTSNGIRQLDGNRTRLEIGIIQMK